MGKSERPVTPETDPLLFFDRELSTPTLRLVAGGQLCIQEVGEAIDPGDMDDRAALPPKIQQAIRDITE